MSTKGRPRAELVVGTERELVARARRLQRLEEQLDDARTALAETAAAALDEGASLRAIGDAIGRTPSTVHALLSTHTKGDA